MLGTSNSLRNYARTTTKTFRALQVSTHRLNTKKYTVDIPLLDVLVEAQGLAKLWLGEQGGLLDAVASLHIQ